MIVGLYRVPGAPRRSTHATPIRSISSGSAWAGCTALCSSRVRTPGCSPRPRPRGGAGLRCARTGLERRRQECPCAVLAQNGYIVGAPTYVPVGELALCRVISGNLPRPVYPGALAHSANGHWQGRARLSLMFTDSYAGTGTGSRAWACWRRPCCASLTPDSPSATCGCSTRSASYSAPTDRHRDERQRCWRAVSGLGE